MSKMIKKRNKPQGKKTRREQRRDKRKEKKQRRHDYYVNRNKSGKYVQNNETTEKESKPITKTNVAQTLSASDIHTKHIKKEKDLHKKLKKDMEKQRRKQLKAANESEDRNIKQLEKQLKLNKRKTKSIPKTFANDGLDYLLEVCEPENMKSLVSTEQHFTDINDDFEDDFALVTGKSVNEESEENESVSENEIENISQSENDLSEEENSVWNKHVPESFQENNSPRKDLHKKNENKLTELSETEYSENENLNSKIKQNKKRKQETTGDSEKRMKIKDTEISDFDASDSETEDEVEETWEDIYGRTRTKDGAVISKTDGKYIPPALRAQEISTLNQNQRCSERASRLNKQLKGLFNRLAESNMHSISSQIDEMYMSNSRNDMNETVTQLIFEALIARVISPERLVLEHVMLITILHANVGTEVGAHFLQSVVKKFNELYNKEMPVENKELDNVINIVAQLYNFKVFDSQLLYQILAKLSEKFEEKHVECILLILRNVGFNLRKDDPLALKQLILDLQKKAVAVTNNNPRVKYMLNILLAIKNNNVSKIPNYDNTYSEHLKKLLKGFIRKGNYVTQLNISLDDLLKADERGRWWVVGSAWTGNEETKQEKDEKSATTLPNYNQELLELARKQRMNTDTRRNIFCIIMTADGYLDAFEKLLHLGLKNQQEREIIHVLIHCCLQEKKYNPYYGLLAQRFCEYDRKYQMTIRCSMWDKLKTLTECSRTQISILARLLMYLFLNQGLPISVLKVVQFSELDKVILRFMRQILLGILLHDNSETCMSVFEKVAASAKLKMFRESLRLFIHHFLLRNLGTSILSEEQKELLSHRAKSVEKLLTVSENKTKF